MDIGVYTVQVSSSDNGVGEVLVEVYEITDDTTAVISSDSDNDGFIMISNCWREEIE